MRSWVPLGHGARREAQKDEAAAARPAPLPMRRDAAALAGMMLGSAVDWSRLGPLGFVEICGNPESGLAAQVGAHLFAYMFMLGAMALAAIADPRIRAAAWLHAAAMCAGMAAADLAAPALPGALTPGLSLAMMVGGMAAGTLAARFLVVTGATRPAWTETPATGGT